MKINISFLFLLILILSPSCKASIQEESKGTDYSKKRSIFVRLIDFLSICGTYSCEQNYQALDYEDRLSINDIPKEIIFNISYYLDPLDVKYLQQTSTHFNFFNDYFWKKYLKFYNYKIWIANYDRIAFANFWYKKGHLENDTILIEKALMFGHPDAKSMKKNSSKSEVDKEKMACSYFISPLERYNGTL